MYYCWGFIAIYYLLHPKITERKALLFKTERAARITKSIRYSKITKTAESLKLF